MITTEIPSPADKRLRATLIGGGAVLLWALLALFTTWAGGIPPFQLVAMAFGIAFVVSLAVLALRGREALARLRQRPVVWLIGVSGLFGYHFFYFVALGNAPAVDAGLIAYLWPLLIVVFSALLPGERLRWFHLAGALMGLAGAGLLVTGGGAGLTIRGEFAMGYLAAFACALTWTGYSLLNRRLGTVPTEVVVGFYGATALLGLLCHLALETTVMPGVMPGATPGVTPGAGQWLAVLALGMGPVGVSFFLWDYGTKHGNIQVLGAFAYAAPLLSTFLLIAFGKAEATWVVAGACALIVAGALLAANEFLRGKAPS